MCSLHLTHPSVHTWSSGQPTVQRPGSSRGLPVGAGIRTHNLGLPRVSSPTLYPLGQRLPLIKPLCHHKDDIKPTGVGFQGLFKTHLCCGGTDHTSAGAGSSCPERAAPVCRWGWGWAWRRRSSSSSQAWRAEEPPADESDCRPDQWCSPQTCRPAAVTDTQHIWLRHTGSTLLGAVHCY